MPETFAPEFLSTARLRLAPLATADVAEVHAIFADPGTWLHLPSGRHTALAQAERMVAESERSWAASGLGRWAIRLRHDLPGPALSGSALPGPALSGSALPGPALSGSALPGTALPGTALPGSTRSGTERSGTVLAAGTLIGVASATLMVCGARNFGYRLTPASWGVGLATEAATVTLAAARDSPYPVTARALASNPASVRVLERIGLTRVWRGHGAGPGTTPAETTRAPTALRVPAAATPGHRDTTAPEHPDTTAPDTTPLDTTALDTTVLERLIFADRPLSPEMLAAIIRLG